ncbi:MAG: outer membrane beta-barrel protein [Planctomycetaceae bacterium]
MRKLSRTAYLLTGLAVALAASQVKAGNWLTEDLGDPWDLTNSVLGEDSDIDIGGWTQFGYHNESDGVFNTHPDHVDLQQGYLYLEKVADGSEGVDFGGRLDVMYGTDAQNTQAFGNRPGNWDFMNGFDHGVYGWALPQAYLEAAYGDWSVKAGHFYTLMGYELVTAPGNFFYSHAFTHNFGEAFTHTGAVATYAASDDVTLYGGWTLGWDTGFDQFNDGSNFLGGASVAATDDVTVTYIVTAGNLGWLGDGYAHTLVADWVINDEWEYIFQSDYVGTDAIGGGHFDTIGVNQYLFYTISDKVKAGGRAEWWKAHGVSYYEMSLGVNVLPTANFRIRPEIRYQWAPGTTTATNPFGITVDETIFGIDAILIF